MEKEAQRLLYREKRNRLTEHECQLKSAEIFRKLTASHIYRDAKKIFTYVSMGQEVDTVHIIEHAIASQKIVAAPKVFSNYIVFYSIKSLDVLVKGKMGILEPDGASEIYRPCQDTLILVPGLVFDVRGNRIGYGRGYYDRYLSQIQPDEAPAPGNIIGLCYKIQLAEAVMADVHDVKVDGVMTD